MSLNKTGRFYLLVLALLGFIVISASVHASISYRSNPKIYYVLVVIWTLILSGLLFGLYRKDIEIGTEMDLIRFAEVSSALVSKLRSLQSALFKSQTSEEVKEYVTMGIRDVLNLAHEHYSLMKGLYCTASVAAILSGNGKRVCKIIQYDDFVPNARREKEVEIPVDKGLFGEIIRRGLRALTIDDYKTNRYPIYPVPIIEEGYCVSGICVPIMVNDKITAFLNIDSTELNIFRPNGDEKIAIFFAELIGELMQVGEYKMKEIKDVAK